MAADGLSPPVPAGTPSTPLVLLFATLWINYCSIVAKTTRGFLVFFYQIA